MGAGRQRIAPPTELAAAIRTLRTLMNLSQDRFAAELGVTTNTVKRWERGHVPQPENQDALVRLGVREDLFPVTRLVGDRHLEKQMGQVQTSLKALQREMGEISSTVQRLTELVDPE